MNESEWHKEFCQRNFGRQIWRDYRALHTLIQLRDLIAEITLVRALVADTIQRHVQSAPSPRWEWNGRHGRLYVHSLLASVWLRPEEDQYYVIASLQWLDGDNLELTAALRREWSLAQCKRWVEQWVASQDDATIAAYDAAEYAE